MPRFPALPQMRSHPVLFFGLGFGVTVWAQASQPCLTFECRRKGPCGPANLAAIKDINYAIINRLRRARDWVTGTAPQPVLKDGDIYYPGHWPLHGPVPNPGSLIAEPKPRSPAGPENIPFPSAAAPSPHGKHIWDLQYKRPKLQLTAGRKQEKLQHHRPEPGETFRDAWSRMPPARLGPCSQCVPVARVMLLGWRRGGIISCPGMGAAMPAGGLAPSWGICPTAMLGAAMPPRSCP